MCWRVTPFNLLESNDIRILKMSMHVFKKNIFKQSSIRNWQYIKIITCLCWCQFYFSPKFWTGYALWAFYYSRNSIYLWICRYKIFKPNTSLCKLQNWNRKNCKYILLSCRINDSLHNIGGCSKHSLLKFLEDSGSFVKKL